VGQARAGQVARVWADETTVQIEDCPLPDHLRRHRHLPPPRNEQRPSPGLRERRRIETSGVISDAALTLFERQGSGGRDR
jgi:hypothetical protein